MTEVTDAWEPLTEGENGSIESREERTESRELGMEESRDSKRAITADSMERRVKERTEQPYHATHQHSLEGETRGPRNPVTNPWKE